MSTAQHASPSSQVFVHPACANNPFVIRRIERETGCAAVWSDDRARLIVAPHQPDHDLAPWGGDAA